MILDYLRKYIVNTKIAVLFSLFAWMLTGLSLAVAGFIWTFDYPDYHAVLGAVILYYIVLYYTFRRPIYSNIRFLVIKAGTYTTFFRAFPLRIWFPFLFSIFLCAVMYFCWGRFSLIVPSTFAGIGLVMMKFANRYLIVYLNIKGRLKLE